MTQKPEYVRPHGELGETGAVELAVLTDIHGNSLALDAAISDAQGVGATDWLVLGDVAAMGNDPVGTIERLERLDLLAAIRGNTDRYVLTDTGPFPPTSELLLEPALVDQMVQIAASLAWTKGSLTSTIGLGWLSAMTPRHELSLPDGTSVCAVHASIDADDGPGITPEASDDEMESLFGSAQCDVVLGGHTHVATDRLLGDLRLVNPGSVSNCIGPDKRAAYLLIHSDEHGHEIEHRRVDYDIDEAIRRTRASGIPGADFLIDHYLTS